jgi:hypothetical protein
MLRAVATHPLRRPPPIQIKCKRPRAQHLNSRKHARESRLDVITSDGLVLLLRDHAVSFDLTLGRRIARHLRHG